MDIPKCAVCGSEAVLVAPRSGGVTQFRPYVQCAAVMCQMAGPLARTDEEAIAYWTTLQRAIEDYDRDRQPWGDEAAP